MTPSCRAERLLAEAIGKELGVNRERCSGSLGADTV
jgi:hypothetical protein